MAVTFAGCPPRPRRTTARPVPAASTSGTDGHRRRGWPGTDARRNRTRGFRVVRVMRSILKTASPARAVSQRPFPARDLAHPHPGRVRKEPATRAPCVVGGRRARKSSRWPHADLTVPPHIPTGKAGGWPPGTLRLIPGGRVVSRAPQKTGDTGTGRYRPGVEGCRRSHRIRPRPSWPWRTHEAPSGPRSPRRSARRAGT